MAISTAFPLEVALSHQSFSTNHDAGWKTHRVLAHQILEKNGAVSGWVVVI